MSADLANVIGHILGVFREALGRQDLAETDDFLDAGGDSLTITEVILDIEARYGVPMSIGEIMAAGSAFGIAQLVVSKQDSNAQTSPGNEEHAEQARGFLSYVRDSGKRTPIIIVPGLYGNAGWALTLSNHLPDKHEIAAFLTRKKPVLRQPVRPLPSLTAEYAKTIHNELQRNPPLVAGYSLGAHVALSLANELGRIEAPPPLVAVLDDEADLDKRNFGFEEKQVAPLTEGEWLYHSMKMSPAEPIASNLIYFRAEENEADYRSDPTGGWGEIATGGVTVIDVPATHLFMIEDHAFALIGAHIDEYISDPPSIAPPPDAGRMRRFEIRRAARRGDLAAELALSEALVNDDREQPSWFYANLADALFQKGDLSEALTNVHEARRRDKWPLSTDLRFLPLFKEHRLKDEMRRLVDDLQQLQFDHPSVHAQAARANHMLDRQDQVAFHVREGLSMQPDHLHLFGQYCRYLERERD